MTTITERKMIGRGSVKSAAAIALAGFLAFGAFATSAAAEDRRDDNHRGADYRGHVERNDRDHDRGREYRGPDPYRAPPVVYGSPYYYPPPVIYGPGIGISIGID